LLLGNAKPRPNRRLHTSSAQMQGRGLKQALTTRKRNLPTVG
jgi:hypothetical protein